MTTLTNFREYYKTISNSELLHILENPDDYQPLAIEAAKQEFTSRQLSDKAVKDAKEFLVAKQRLKEKQQEKLKVIEVGVKTNAYALVDTLNPIQSGIPTIEKTIRLIVIIFSALFLYQALSDYNMLIAYAQDFRRFPLSSSLILAPLIILPIAIIAFWKRKQIGWTLLTIFLTFTTVGILWAAFQSLSRKSTGFEEFDSLFPQPSPLTFIIQLLFFIGILYVVCRNDMREAFSVNNNKMQATIAVTSVLSFFVIMATS